MKDFGFWIFFCVAVTTLSFLQYPAEADVVFTHNGDAMTVIATSSRKLKENGYANPNSNTGSGTGTVNLEDYHPIDPVPSSKASIRPGPIQHGTPLMPYIPKSAPPPSHPRRGGLPP